MAATKLLLTGATGYVGGTVLTQILNSFIPKHQELTVSVLVRKEEQAKEFAAIGLAPIVFKDLKHDLDSLRKIASEQDVIIHTADSTNTDAAEALVRGLADRANTTGQAGRLIHLSGTSSLGDYPITKTLIETREFNDRDDDVYGYMKYRQGIHSYDQRATDLRIVDTGEQVGVETYIIKAPRIYGRGTGLFNTKSAHIPWFISGAVAAGQAEYVGEGSGLWDDVHVRDLAEFFEILLAKTVAGEKIPSGRKGIYFTATLRHSWKQLAERIAQVGYELGHLKSSEPKSISVEEAAQKYTGGNTLIAEVGLASTSRTAAAMASDMGWRSTRGEEDFQESILEDFKLIYP